ncbi:hypothetical protein EDD99_4834 [Streptomyces sp. 846.5]|nr:hypothetical protein [Streptomyces sp. 846.5]TDU06286.1 hypothetical protein EDD99_4834 [Streptomyces sp. 846.5]
MGTTGTILLVLGAWLVGSLFLGLLVGRMLRYGHLRPRPRPDDEEPSTAAQGPVQSDPLPPPRDTH